MPTPVSTARQCLTEEAARSLDEAVSVARRRCHAQTTSLHAVSALLALPSSSLREACGRARSSAYSPRLQFRALELSVGVSLDRLPTAKGLEEPPISNSLMAAIKRSQANQRRHPETFQFYQNLHYHSNNPESSQPSISAVKVEMKHFILSILDDPVVSRVFGEAGFRSCDIKLAILNPPPVVSSSFSKTRLPPLFLCNLSDLELNKLRLKFPFSGVLDSEGIDENSRRIGEIFVKKSARNALLVGVCAIDALHRFTESVQKGQAEFLPKEIDKLSVITLERDIISSEEIVKLKFKQVDEMITGCKDTGVAVNYGDLKVLVDHGESEMEKVNQVVLGLSRLLEVHKGRLWLIGAAASYDTYMKFLAWFPSVEKDWDLHLLPITSSKLSMGESYSRPGLMGSFVPFGGFFPSSSDYEYTLNNKSLPTGRCCTCDERYEQEASIIVKGGGSNASVADHPYSPNQPSWMRMAQYEKNKSSNIGEGSFEPATYWYQSLYRGYGTLHPVMQEGVVSDVAQLSEHGSSSLYPKGQSVNQVNQFVIVSQLIGAFGAARGSMWELHLCLVWASIAFMSPPPVKPKLANDDKTVLNAQLMTLQTKWNDICLRLHCNQPYPPNSSPNARFPEDVMHSNNSGGSSSGLQLNERSLDNPKPSESQNIDLLKSVPREPGVEKVSFMDPLFRTSNSTLRNSSLNTCSVSPVTTDLGLGTLVSPDANGPLESHSVVRTSPSSVSQMCGDKLGDDFKSLWKVLSGKVGYQEDAVYTICQTVATCKTGHGRRLSSSRGNIWLSFHGPDKVGKRRVSTALAEAVFGSSENLLRVDLGSVNKFSCSNTVLDRHDQKLCRVNFRGKTPVDYIAEELSKKANHVFLLENIDKADMLVQHSLSQAIRTGKFPDSYGREMSVNNVIFVLSSDFVKDTESAIDYSEDRILAALDSEMRISVGGGYPSGDNANNIVVTSSKGNATPVFGGTKRKQIDQCQPGKSRQKPKRDNEDARSRFDLNLPVEEMEEEDDDDDNYQDDNDTGSGSGSGSCSESSKTWVEDLWDEMDGRAIFKPFDTVGLVQRVTNEIKIRFLAIFGNTSLLEIESKTLMQILAATLLSERKEKALEEWITNVLCKSFKEIKLKYNDVGVSEKVVKLLSCENRVVEDHASGIFLPKRVFIE